MTDTDDQEPNLDIAEARQLFPATDQSTYFNTAAVGLASRALAAAYHSCVDEWTESGFDYVRGEQAAENARTAVASLIGADRADVALIASVSAAAGLVAAQFGAADAGQNVVIVRTGIQLQQLPMASTRQERVRGTRGPVPQWRPRTWRHRSTCRRRDAAGCVQRRTNRDRPPIRHCGYQRDRPLSRCTRVCRWVPNGWGPARCA